MEVKQGETSRVDGELSELDTLCSLPDANTT